MTWQNPRKPTDASADSPFARLAPLIDGEKIGILEWSLERLAVALKSYPGKVRLHVRLVGGPDGEKVEHWAIEDGAVQRGEPKRPDVVVVMRQETWMQIAQGQLAPYDALYAGKLRVGGNFELAKQITKHLSDPSARYVPPC